MGGVFTVGSWVMLFKELDKGTQEATDDLFSDTTESIEDIASDPEEKEAVITNIIERLHAYREEERE
jgi:hypothetical protein